MNEYFEEYKKHKHKHNMTIKLCFFNKLNRIRFNHNTKTMDLNPNLGTNVDLKPSHINNHEYLLLNRIHTDIMENVTVVNILI
jgi:hypothetical protein